MILKLIFTRNWLALIFAGSLLFGSAKAQHFFYKKQEINIADIQTQLLLSPKQFEVAASSVTILNPNDISKLAYQNMTDILPASGKMRGNANAANIYIKTLFHNSSDTAIEIFFYPGHYFKSVFVFKQSTQPGSNVQTIAERKPENFRYADGYRGIVLQAGETSFYYIQLQPVRIQVNTFRPELIQPAFLSAQAARVREDDNQISILTYIIVGIMGMMIIFSFANFIVTGKREFLYYCLYTLLNGSILFGKTYLYLSTSDFNYFFEEYLDFMLLLGGIVFYVYFLRSFLEITTENNKLLSRVLQSIEALSILSALVYSFMYFLTDDISGLTLMEMIMKYIILGVGIMFIVIGIKERNKLMNYIVLGNACVIVFGFISLTIIVAPVQESAFYSHALFYYEMGIVGELAFFLLGLTYKSRKELIAKVKTENAISHENDKRDFEKQLAIIQARQEERNRISADMHDELGGGMTAIRLMSELAKQRIHRGDIPEIEKISASANDLLSKMNAIIWSMSPTNDTLANLVAYVRSFAYEFFENTTIDCVVNVDEHIPSIEVSGIKRRNIFLSVKESLNNTILYTGVSAVIIDIAYNEALVITTTCDATGILKENTLLVETGLKNIAKRMETIHGKFQTNNNSGTVVILTAAL